MALKFEEALELLTAAHQRGRQAHALLVSGPSGAGKEELAVKLVEELQGGGDQGVDLWGEEVKSDAQSLSDIEGEFVRVIRPRSKSRRIRVEQIRELEKPLQLAAPEGTWKVGVIVDADRMGEEASNAFLKTLEEPPDSSLLMLLTCEPSRLLPTILSRCVEVPLLARESLEERFREETQNLALALEELSQNGAGPWSALRLKGAFEDDLAAVRSRLDAEITAEMKLENEKYKQTSEGQWLANREEELKAGLAADLILLERSLLDWLALWMSDALKSSLDAGHCQLEGLEASSRAFGGGQEPAELLRRCEALQDLARSFETNVSRPLALDVGFLKAFG